jgi:hypothetical protein
MDQRLYYNIDNLPPNPGPDIKSGIGLENGYTQGKAGEYAEKKFPSKQIISKLRESEVLISQGQTDQTCYRWRKAYGGVKIDPAQRLRELE